MSLSSQLTEFFLVGLFTSTHCLVMCGAIVGALTFSLPAPVRDNPALLLRYVMAFNGGRLLSYAAAGFLMGAFGEALFGAFDLHQGHPRLLMIISAGFLAIIGLHIAGWLPGVALLERAGARLWRALEPVAHGLLPTRSLGQALGFGLIWGWFPCGLTYTVLLWAATTGGAFKGLMAMIAFGAGTLPGIVLASFFSGRLPHFGRSPGIRRALGVSLVLLAVVMGRGEAQPTDLECPPEPPAQRAALEGSARGMD